MILTGVIVFLAEAVTGRFHARPISSAASATDRSRKGELADIDAARNLILGGKAERRTFL